MDEWIPVFKPYIGVDTSKAATDALDLGWLGMGSYVRDFESEIAKYIGLNKEGIGEDKQVVVVNTGTSALHLALLIAGVAPGDEVITPSFNNIGDFQAMMMVGAEPVFCDLREENLGIDVEKAEALIGPKTKAIIGMDYAGSPCDWDELHAMAKRRGLRVIHDAAHSMGSEYKGKKIGSFGDLVMFSFDPVKNITAIDGGALVVKTGDDVDKLHRYRLLGMDQKAARMYTNNRAWTYDVSSVGFRYHMPNIHAAIGLSQLKRLDEFTLTRQESCRLYSELLADVPGIITPRYSFDGISPFIYWIRVLDDKRQRLIPALLEEGVDTGIHWIPGHNFSLLRHCRKGDLEVTDTIGSQILTLPLHSYMRPSTVVRVVEAIKKTLPKL